jgi:Fe-S cluster assembly protein SufD
MEGKEIIARAEKYSASLNGSTLKATLPQRENAIKTLKEKGFPKPKSEAYKYTNISKSFKEIFEKSDINESSSLSKDSIEKFFIKDIEANHLVFVNGNYEADLSTIISDKNVVKIESFEQYAKNNEADLSAHFGKFASAEKDALTALNTVYSNNGLLIEIADKAIIDEPIICYHITDSSTNSTVVFPRTLYKIGQSAKVSFIHFYHTVGEHASLVNEVNEVILKENADCHFYKIQNDQITSNAVGETKVYQPNNSRFSAYTFTLEGTVIRNNLNIDVDGQGCEANMYGMYLTQGKTHVDNNTTVDHIQPNSISNELYKGVMDGKSRGVFNGKIYVRKEAQKTNAFQSNNNILLSDSAIINTKPQLEIWADDVKCSHGCTIGQLDEEGIFYLRSRGISEQKARAMMLYAFTANVIEKIEFEWLRNYLEEEIAKRLDIG